jgi:hypothetical protein
VTAGYSVALVVHLFALLAAIGASTVVHLAMHRAGSARRAADALPWLGLAHAFSRAFPVSLLLLLASGAWLVHSGWTWDTGFVWAGLTASSSCSSAAAPSRTAEAASSPRRSRRQRTGPCPRW